MTKVDDTARDSRAGDQFHYLWAARRCLGLLAPADNLVAVTVEGGSLEEGEASQAVGEQVIDVGEYYGSERLREAERVRYLQLKHSTRRKTTPWKPSELAHTLAGFAEKFAALPAGLDPDRFTWEVVSNRPVPDSIKAAVQALGRGEPVSNAALGVKLIGYTGLEEDRARAFYARVRFLTDEPDFITQRALLIRDAAAILNDTDRDATTVLKDLVSAVASGELKDKRSIRREDILLRWGVSEQDLLPAPSRIEPIANRVPRAQYGQLAADVAAATAPVLIHAPAGVGKTVFSLCLGDMMPAGSVTLTYDCYGGGKDDNYRQRSKSRHLLADALVQMANELAGQGLCPPLIPIGHLQPRPLLRAFWSRLAQAVDTVRARSPEALVCLVFDAVDNAEMAAAEFQDGRSFAYTLLRETVPEGVRIVTLCRPERRALLSPPASVVQRPLKPFDLDETRAHLRTRYPSATDHDGSDFHRLSSRNPRVQANALALVLPLPEMLHTLGPDPKTVDAIIARQLETALAFQKDNAGHDPAALDRLCAAIAVLRPLIPISFLSELSGLTAEAIVSFATEFAGGRPLMVVGDAALQFRDEPVEDWFRRQYRPTSKDLPPFINILKPHAATSAYVAANLPGLMLEADQFDELVEMTLQATNLPAAKGSQKREIDVQRLTFALRAAIRLKRWPEAIKLALRAGEENAGEKREQDLFQDQYDLTARFIDAGLIQDAVAKRRISRKWNGARHAYEAAVLSGSSALIPDARSRLRMSDGWLRARLDLPADDRDRRELKVIDLSPRVFALFNIAGPRGAVGEIMRWRPPAVQLELARTFARTLVDHGRWTDLEDVLAFAAEKRVGPILAAGIEELAVVGRWPSAEVARRAWALGLGEKAIPRNPEGYGEDRAVGSVLSVAEAAVFHHVAPHAEIAARLKRRFPGKPHRLIGSRYSEGRGPGLRYWCLRAALEGKDLEPQDVAPEQLRKEWTPKAPYSGESSDLRDFKRIVGALLPWWKLRAAQIVALGRGEPLDLAPQIDAALKESTARKEHYEEVGYDLDDQIAGVWFSLLCRGQLTSGVEAFAAWHASKGRPLFAPTHIRLARMASRTPGFEPLAFAHAEEASRAFASDPMSTAEARLSANIDICRALLAHSEPEARAFFDEASEMAVHVGDEAYSRWSALTALANGSDAAPASDAERQAVAGKFARCAEFAREHLDKHFSAAAAMRSLTALSPPAAVATLSRWVDRDLGFFDEQLPGLIEALLEKGRLSGATASAFIGFQADWTWLRLVEAADRDVHGAARASVVERLNHYLALSPIGAGEWAEMAGRFPENAAFGRLVAANLAARRRSEREAIIPEPVVPRRKPRPPTRAWKRVFAGLDLTSPAGLAEARERASAQDLTGSDAFWAQTLRRAPAGREADVLQAIVELAPEAMDLRAILPAVPDAWRARRAVKLALKALVDAVVRKDWRFVTRGHRWDLMPLDRMTAVGLTRSEIFEAAVEGAGSEGEFGGPDQIFGLVDLMASLATPSETLAALDFGLDRMSASIPGTFGEIWTADRLAPDDVETCLAGLLWVTLGSPRTARRWEAAHVVRALLSQGPGRVVEQLTAFEAGASPAPFLSLDLPFYDLHARQWWLHAVASAALRSPDRLAFLASRLKALAVRSHPHMIMRELAARSLLSLDAASVAALSTDEREALRTINESRLAPVASKRWADPYDRDGKSRFHIPYDFGKAELTSLANCFVASRPGVWAAVEKVIRDQWGIAFDGSWEDEPRKDHRALRDGRRRRGEDAAHSWSDYLAMHAAITVGGLWLETRPTRLQDYDSEGVSYWCERYLPTRVDGLWLSDLRSPAPAVRRPPAKDADWRWSVSRADLLEVVGGTEVAVWGSWSDRAGDAAEQVQVRSALIQAGPPLALLAAAQTAGEPWDCPLPRSGDPDWEVAAPGFRLKGWLAAHEGDTGADRDDPWAAEMSYPPPAPDAEVVRRLRLRPEPALGGFVDRQGRPLFRSLIWSSAADYRGEQTGPRGSRLTVPRRRLPKLLKRLKADLLICISMNRQRLRYDTGLQVADHEVEYADPYFLHLLVTRDGQFHTL